MLPSVRIVWRTAAILAALIAIILFGDYYLRCHGKPLSREEALQRASAQLKYLSRNVDLGNPSPALVEEQYDAPSKTWSLTFRNSSCEVSVIADRCHGTDIGGISEGCKQR
jgi:hypothetical protein